MIRRLRFAAPHLVMLLVSLALYAAARQIDTSAAAGRIGPDFWPKLVIGLMALLCAYEGLRRLAFGPPAADPAAPKPEGEDDEPTHWGQLGLGTALVVGFMLGVPYIGFFLATALFLAGFSWVGGFRRPLLCAVIGLAGASAMLVMFMRIAYISLPLGEGPFRSLSTALLALIGVK